MLIHFEHVDFGYDGIPILQDVELSVFEGERIGFVGGNGEGKTTLLKLLVGELEPDRGTIERKNRVRVGYLAQTGGFDSSSTVYGAMKEVFREDEALIEKLREASELVASAGETERRELYERIEKYEKQIAARDSYHFDVRIKTVLGGMGFEGMFMQEVGTMSGGERTKLKLCKLLLEEPDLLVLDEPTNHLDLKTLFFLEDYLSSFRGAIVVVSHDRYFLDRLTARTLELEGGKLSSYKGNYSKYKELKAIEVLEKTRAYERQQEEIARLKDYVDRNLVRATTAKSALSRVNKLERMEVLERPQPPKRPPRFCYRCAEKPYERVLEAKGIRLEADGKLLLPDAEFTLMRGEKCALVGDNGTGKSTLLKYFLSGRRNVVFGRMVKYAYYDQENADLDLEERALDAMWERAPALSQTEVRAMLARVGLDAEDIDKKVKELSGGMRAKLELCMLEVPKANLLILDEPTNHLDLPAREALEDALADFDGTLLFVSHDRRFIERLATCVCLIEDRKLTFFKGSYAQFLETRSAAPPPTPVKEEKKPAEGYRSKEDRAREAKQRTRVREIETRLEEIERIEAELGEELARCAADYQKVREISERIDALHAESDALYAEYETLI